MCCFSCSTSSCLRLKPGHLQAGDGEGAFRAVGQWGVPPLGCTIHQVGQCYILQSGRGQPVETRGCGVAVDFSPHLLYDCRANCPAKAEDPAQGPHLPRLWIWLELHTSGRTHAHTHISVGRRPYCPDPGFGPHRHLDGLMGRPLLGKITNGQLLLSFQLAHFPLRFSLSRPEPVNTFHSAADS